MKKTGRCFARQKKTVNERGKREPSARAEIKKGKDMWELVKGQNESLSQRLTRDVR